MALLVDATAEQKLLVPEKLESKARYRLKAPALLITVLNRYFTATLTEATAISEVALSTPSAV